MKFVPLPQFMVSYDVVCVFGATIKWSSPASPLAVSNSLPGSKRSSPSPPFSVSLERRPESLSEPARPLSVSFSLVPVRLSLPDVPPRITASTLDVHTKREARTKATSITGNVFFMPSSLLRRASTTQRKNRPPIRPVAGCTTGSPHPFSVPILWGEGLGLYLVADIPFKVHYSRGST